MIFMLYMKIESIHFPLTKLKNMFSSSAFLNGPATKLRVKHSTNPSFFVGYSNFL